MTITRFFYRLNNRIEQKNQLKTFTMRLILINVLLFLLFTTSTFSVMYTRKSVSKEKYNSKLFIILNLKNSQIKKYLQNQKDDGLPQVHKTV